MEKYYSLSREEEPFLNFDALMKNQGNFERAEVSTDDDFVIIHTAAVAGRPKGALLSHGNVLCADMHFDYFFNLSPQDTHLNILPLFHVGGLFMATSAFHAGALNITMNKFDVAKAVELIDEKKVSFMMEFAPILSSLLEQHEKTGKDIRSLRAVSGLEVRRL